MIRFDAYYSKILLLFEILITVNGESRTTNEMDIPKNDDLIFVLNEFNRTNNNHDQQMISGFNYIGFNESIESGSFESEHARHYWALILLFCPISTIFGNILVVLSVIREKSLRTVTNYFVVSLALADLTVAAAVMPFAVYYEVTRKWHLTNIVCDAWVATDVMASTASILNLVAIAIDRFIAVTRPIKYARHKNSNRIYLMIAFVWLLSIAIASPILIGLNNTPDREVNQCSFNNDKFLIYSSMFSFYIPTLVMIILYYRIFKVIRSRAKKAQAAKINNRKPTNPTALSNKSDRKLTDQTNENNQKVNLISPRIFNLKNKTIQSGSIVDTGPKNSITLPAERKKSSQPRNSTDKGEKRNQSLGMLSINVLRTQIHQSAASNKERKVTKTLLIVLIVFLVCWSPFFAVNNLMKGICKEFKIDCPFIKDELISFLTWLGYLNSMINPVIYTIFNIEFRKSFAKILSEYCCKKSKN